MAPATHGSTGFGPQAGPSNAAAEDPSFTYGTGAAQRGTPLYFNAGMFVHEPSMATAKALLDTLRVTPPTPFAEQVSERSIDAWRTRAQALELFVDS